jgi:putative heme-binding domain-containing protein
MFSRMLAPPMRHHLPATFLFFALATVVRAHWASVEVPPARPLPEASSLWYRCYLQVDDRLVVPEANNPRDLWRNSTMLVLADLPGPFGVFLNGERILASPGIPVGESQRFKVPKDILRSRLFNSLVIRLDGEAAKRGLTRAPMLIDYFNEVVLDAPWTVAFDEVDASESGPLEARPEVAAYLPSDWRLSSTPLDRPAEPIPGKRVPPAEALALLQTDEDLIVEELLHEPEVAQPTHVSFDARGRMWVAQYRQYPFPKGVKMISRDQYYRSRYDRVPPAPPYHDHGADIISVHEDRDGDGTYESSTNVLEGLNMANAALSGWGGIWVMHTPYLLFYPDADGDDVPDGSPEVRLAGFGLEDTHSVANGLAWGPDGWLYGAQGSTTTSRITRPGIDPPDSEGIFNEGCLVWRYHPKTRAIEIFADGGGNTFGLSFDAEGRLFSGHNGGETRGWHHIQDGLFLKQGKDPGKFGPPPNPFAFGELPMMHSTNPVPRFSHMSVVAGGSALPARLQGKFLCVDPLHHHVVAAERKRVGSTFETTDLGFPLRSDDGTFRPVYLANAPDGSMIIADFREDTIAHGQNYQGQIDPESGRIYRLRGKAEALEKDVNLEAKSSAELVAILEHPNLWHRQTAVRLLGQRADGEAVPALQSLLARPEAHPPLEALWALHQMGKLDPATALGLLDHPAPVVRAWAIRLTGDARVLPDEFLAKLGSLALTEPDAEVRCQILSTARRLPVGQALALVGATLRDDLNDAFIPLMAWFVIESHCAAESEAVLGLFEADEIWSRPIVRQQIVPRLMRRFAEAGTRTDFLTCAKLLEMAPTAEDRAALMAGFEQAFEGRVPPPLPDELVAATGKGSLSLRIRQGDPAALAEGLVLLDNAQADPRERLSAIRAFGTATHSDAIVLLLKIATTAMDASLRQAALVSLQIYNDPAIGEALVSSYPAQPESLQPAVLNLLASRPAWALALLEACAADTISKSAIGPELLARMKLHGGEPLGQMLVQQFPGTESPKPAERIEALKAILAAKPGDPYRGEATFAARCFSCHTLFFKGGKVGPDLTRYQREDLSTMLVSILDPNAEIREGFENHVVTTKDGRVLGGFLIDSDTNAIVLRGVDGSDTTLPRETIANLTPVGRSLMPEGLLDGLDDQQLRDFFAYLKISQPISR